VALSDQCVELANDRVRAGCDRSRLRRKGRRRCSAIAQLTRDLAKVEERNGSSGRSASSSRNRRRSRSSLDREGDPDSRVPDHTSDQRTSPPPCGRRGGFARGRARTSVYHAVRNNRTWSTTVAGSRGVRGTHRTSWHRQRFRRPGPRTRFGDVTVSSSRQSSASTKDPFPVRVAQASLRAAAKAVYP